ncbi:uncharacterized protein N7483_010831 [Penicillium malachiteum]|uniref:uncharacterized protein n=1 Tax=Penicillium malachiteum TaxID=1324776 RepID=UPI0025469CE6|nr:uncharacterized protein N7483_010831 [Penicillium malachiteum]KAJ5713650.1 hypothetical protein N7483_010831 [Penicillium malachiteum]
MTTILFVPGAWITIAAYEPFMQALRAEGHDVRYAGYPSLDPKNPSTQDCQTDTQAIAAVLRPLVEEGKDVLLVLHSYAGMPGAAAAVGLSRSQRAKEGQSGGVFGLVFIGAFVVPEGLSCAGLQGGNLPPWILLDKPLPHLNIADDPAGNFAADMDPDSMKSLMAELRSHATLAFTSPQPHPAWADEEFEGRSAFIVTANDRAVPKEAQFGMMAATQKTWIVKEIEAGHCSPFFNKKQETVALIQEILKEIPGA